MPSPTPPVQQPAMVVPCSGADVRQVSDTHAEVIIRNPLVVASLVVDRAQLQTLADALAEVAGTLGGSTGRLVTPDSPGGLVVPGQ